jgi:hypothetical protein
MSKDADTMIARLQKKLNALEQEVNEVKKGINLLCKLDNKPIMYPDSEELSQTVNLQLRGDEYHNMPQATAITEILEKRRAADLAPVTVDEIYDDLIAGGFEFTKGKNEAIQKRGIAIAMSKNRKFYKLPNEKWGIKSWYGIQETKNSSRAESDSESDGDTKQENPKDPKNKAEQTDNVSSNAVNETEDQ